MITVSGGAGVLISDIADSRRAADAGNAGGRAEDAARPGAVLRAAQSGGCDRAGKQRRTLIHTFTEALVKDGGYASVLGFFSMTASSRRWPCIREQLNADARSYPDRLYVLSVIAPPDRRDELEADGWVVHEDPTRAVTAIAAMGRFGAAFAAPALAAPPTVPPVTLPATTPKRGGGKAPACRGGHRIRPGTGVRQRRRAVAAAEQFGFPVVMKILSPDILHKSEIGGVLLNVADAAAVRDGYDAAAGRARRSAAPTARIEGVLVAKQLKGGVECILGIHRDPVFGPIAMFGLGGIFVEVMKDVVFRRCPFGEDVAEQMIRSIKGAPLLLGARGRPAGRTSRRWRRCWHGCRHSPPRGTELQSIDLNPVFAMPEGQGAFAADAVIEVTSRAQELSHAGVAASDVEGHGVQQRLGQSSPADGMRRPDSS